MPLPVLAALLLTLQGPPSIKVVYERCRPSVVSIETTDADGGASGTGFFYGDGRTVVTSLHVLLGATSIDVRDDRGHIWHPKTVAIDVAGDMAVLNLGVETGHTGLPHAPSQEVSIGDEILVIGDPEGLRATLSTGVVSSLRTDEGVPIVQITAPISHGSSGGPVLDRRGRVLGVVKAFLREGQNLNLAISTQVAKWILSRDDAVSYARFLAMLAAATAPEPAPEPADAPRTGRPDPAPPESPRRRDPEVSSTGNEAVREALTRDLAAMYTALFIANERWRTEWSDLLDTSDLVDAPLRKRQATMIGLIAADIRAIARDERYEGDALSGGGGASLLESLRSLKTACEASAKAEIDCLTKPSTDAEIDAAVDLVMSSRARRDDGIQAFSHHVTDDLGLSFDVFTDATDPVVICARMLRLCLATPDYDRPDDLVIARVLPKSSFRVGDVITGVRHSAGKFTEVESWAELREGIYESSRADKLSDLEFRARRQGRSVVIAYGIPE